MPSMSSDCWMLCMSERYGDRVCTIDVDAIALPFTIWMPCCCCIVPRWVGADSGLWQCSHHEFSLFPSVRNTIARSVNVHDMHKLFKIDSIWSAILFMTFFLLRLLYRLYIFIVHGVLCVYSVLRCSGVYPSKTWTVPKNISQINRKINDKHW